MLKQLACLEACKQLHLMGALTDNLVPDIVLEEADAQEIGSEPYAEEQAKYFPPELVSPSDNDFVKSYYCYLIELQRNFDYDIPLQDIVLAVKCKLEFGNENLSFDLETDRGSITVDMTYVGVVSLTSQQVVLCQRFQITVFRVLIDNNLDKLKAALDTFHLRNDLPVFDYLLLPSTGLHQKPLIIDWKCVSSVLFPHVNAWGNHTNYSSSKGCDGCVHTKNGVVCSCMVEHSLVYTPHNGHMYCITNVLHGLNGRSFLTLRDGEVISYMTYYKRRHGIDLCYERESFLKGRRVFPVHNFLQKCRQKEEKAAGQSNAFVELPPELCFVIMSPIFINIFYSFSFVPSIMHRIESLLIAANFKKMHADHCMQNVDIPLVKVLEAITTKKCQEKFHLESLETLGDSFLKYAASQQLFKMHQNQHEGFLSVRRERIIANATLCKLGCNHNLPGFIRNEPFDPKLWVIPGDQSEKYALDEELIFCTRKIYSGRRRRLRSKAVADVVEALIGAFLSNGGEVASLSFMDWLGIKVDFINTLYERTFPVDPENLLNIRSLESLLHYPFHDSSLLVETLTHGSYMLPEIPRCYQRLEFLGDAVLDYLITVHLYNKYPGLSPGMLTDLRSASVNNDCYAQSAIKAELHKHVLHGSQELHRHIGHAVQSLGSLSLVSTFGWESETTFPKVLGDIIEIIAGAILVDSGYNKEKVFQSIRPILEPLITPETMRLHRVKELEDLCQKAHYLKKKAVVSDDNGVTSITIEVEANGVIHKASRTAADKKTAKKLASKAVWKSLKGSCPST